MARNKMAKKVVDETAQTVSFTFSDGDVLSIALADVVVSKRDRAALHGISQKGGDAYAGAETVAEAKEACADVIASLKDPNAAWSARTIGVGGGRATVLVEALFRATKAEGRTMDECEQLVADASDEQKASMRKIPAIKKEIDAINAERALEKAEKSAKDAAAQPLDLGALFGA